jgi:hypothetical protein
MGAITDGTAPLFRRRQQQGPEPMPNDCETSRTSCVGRRTFILTPTSTMAWF